MSPKEGFAGCIMSFFFCLLFVIFVWQCSYSAYVFVHVAIKFNWKSVHCLVQCSLCVRFLVLLSRSGFIRCNMPLHCKYWAAEPVNSVHSNSLSSFSSRAAFSVINFRVPDAVLRWHACDCAWNAVAKRWCGAVVMQNLVKMIVSLKGNSQEYRLQLRMIPYCEICNLRNTGRFCSKWARAIFSSWANIYLLHWIL